MLSLGSATDQLSLILRNSSGTIIYQGTTVTLYADGSWHHAVISVDLSATTVTWRIDRATPTITINTAAVDDNIDFEGATVWKLGNIVADAGVNYQGALYDFVFKAGQFVDLTDAGILNDFISSDGRTASGDLFWQNAGPDAGKKPVGYGVGAPIFNGEKADVYFSNCFQYNQGTGGAFVLASTFDTTADPDIYRASAHYDNKERWYDSELTGFSYTKSRTFIEEREGHPKKGLRIGIDERDGTFRQEDPSMTYHQLLFNDREDDSEETDR
jgi:hypothetical protein